MQAPMPNLTADAKSSKRGVFTLSLDCEGLWGMADKRAVVSAGAINDAALNAAYADILETLDKNRLTATAAFVSCFASDLDALRDNLDLFERLAALNPDWFAAILPALKSGELNGWRGAAFYRAMATAGMEMAWHGATHLPLSQVTSAESVALELELATRLFAVLGARPHTIVFPRTLVGHLDALRQAGFDSFRDSPRQRRLGRVVNLLHEFNVVSGCDKQPARAQDGWRICRPGAFLNWPSGARALVPVSVTVARWKAMLRDAAAHGGDVHMWFHPHNLITVPDMKIAFVEIMRFAGELTRSGDLANLTIAQSVSALDPGNAS